METGFSLGGVVTTASIICVLELDSTFLTCFVCEYKSVRDCTAKFENALRRNRPQEDANVDTLGDKVSILCRGFPFGA